MQARSMDADDNGRSHSCVSEPAESEPHPIAPASNACTLGQTTYPPSPESSFASMGNYIFTTDALIDILQADADREDSRHDMGGDIIPAFVDGDGAQVYDFTANVVPGATDRDRTYWRDVGTIDAFYDAHMDLISVHPVFNLYNYQWPIFSHQPQQPPAGMMGGGGGGGMPGSAKPPEGTSGLLAEGRGGGAASSSSSSSSCSW